MIKTSYFARSGRHENAVAICRGVPKWYTGKCYPALAPSWDLIRVARKDLFVPEYYRTVLSKLDPQKVIDDLLALSVEPILLCWEKPSDFCHRQEVAKWLMESTGYVVEEVG